VRRIAEGDTEHAGAETMSANVYKTVPLPADAKPGELVQFDDVGRCGIVIDAATVQVYGTHGTRFVNYPYRLSKGSRAYGVFVAT
jgi:hypothetical protein